ncbi:YihY/virulence factor BrkB family protein [Nocardioides coralli]|uniref:YihY/virulence factor BrkB family protein n=1 Tax=Nocardioides coralli TaxID=2872154 RepID=UPI001CA3F7C2|nr:YhjD/YihY/BrkB family envelope integrity protein [Nocardioides coralli]QZY29906.1 YihY/virulence factor BrkB family protein [Nocardioides coralli]
MTTDVPSVKERVEELRRRQPVIDHAVRTVEHYGDIKGTLQAGAITFFGFLSVFPIMALAFFAIGYVSRVYPQANDQLIQVFDEVLPGLLSTDGTPEPGEISLQNVQDAAGAVGLIGLAGVLYTGLGWLSAMRQALVVTFETADREQPNFVVGKLRDLASLVLIGTTLMLTVAVAGLARAVSGWLLDVLGLDAELGWLVVLVGVVIGLGANTVLFFALFRLLAGPPIPAKSLWKGAAFGAVGFEVLKQLSTFLISSTKGQPAFAVFGSALVLVVWINYFSRVVVFAASWAHVAPAARARRERAELEADRREMEHKELAEVQLREVPSGGGPRVGPGKAFAAGGASMLGLVAWLRRRNGGGS